jgi:hypothetical protein
VWLRNRTYDPSTRAFTTPDPLPAVPGTAYAGYPYHYAGNDPVNQIDPLGLRPLTDADIQNQKDDGGLFGAVGDWWGKNWEYVAGGAMVVAGVILYGFSDSSAEDRVWDLCGQDIVSVSHQSATIKSDPVFHLSSGQAVEIFSDWGNEPWVMQLPRMTFVASPSDPRYVD